VIEDGAYIHLHCWPENLEFFVVQAFSGRVGDQSAQGRDVAVGDRFVPLGCIKEAVEILWVLRCPEYLLLGLGGERHGSPVGLVRRPVGGGDEGHIHFNEDGIGTKLVDFVNHGIAGGRIRATRVLGLMMDPHGSDRKSEVCTTPALQARNELEAGNGRNRRRRDGDFAI
jgi:hypothetical protein